MISIEAAMSKVSNGKVVFFLNDVQVVHTLIEIRDAFRHSPNAAEIVQNMSNTFGLQKNCFFNSLGLLESTAVRSWYK